MIELGVAGVPGFMVTASELATLVPQELVAVTVMFPFCPEVPVVIVMERVAPPAKFVHPVGTDQE